MLLRWTRDDDLDWKIPRGNSYAEIWKTMVKVLYRTVILRGE